MDFSKLLEPYSEGGLRTIAGQIKWLLTKNIPQDKIDQAILHVYNEIEGGKVFVDGNELDQYLLQHARTFHTNDLEVHAKRLEEFFSNMKKKWKEETTKVESLPLWLRIKNVWLAIKAVFKT